DSFDTHAKIPEYFAKVDACTKASHTLSLISTGWDPGLFSLARLLGQSVLPEGEDYTFWGKGLSQGHSDAVRRVAGVKDRKSTRLNSSHVKNSYGVFCLEKKKDVSTA